MNKRKFVGYHGTDDYNARLINRTNHTINYQHIGWLGVGVYFFEANKSLAKNYAAKRHQGKIIRVMKSNIEIPEELIFDTVDNEENKNKFHAYRSVLKKQAIERNKIIKSSNRNNFDGKVYDLISRKEGFKLIRSYTYTPSLKEEQYKIPFSRVPNGIELCLKSTNYVKDKHICSI